MASHLLCNGGLLVRQGWDPCSDVHDAAAQKGHLCHRHLECHPGFWLPFQALPLAPARPGPSLHCSQGVGRAILEGLRNRNSFL